MQLLDFSLLFFIKDHNTGRIFAVCITFSFKAEAPPNSRKHLEVLDVYPPASTRTEVFPAELVHPIDGCRHPFLWDILSN